MSGGKRSPSIAFCGCGVRGKDAEREWAREGQRLRTPTSAAARERERRRREGGTNSVRYCRANTQPSVLTRSDAHACTRSHSCTSGDFGRDPVKKDAVFQFYWRSSVPLSNGSYFLLQHPSLINYAGINFRPAHTMALFDIHHEAEIIQI